MSGPIRDLRSKLRLLIAYGPHRGWKDIGKALQRSPKTVQWWADGSDIRTPGTVPDDRLGPLIDLLRKALPGERSQDEARTLLFGPTTDLEAEFRSAPAVTFTQLIEMEAVRNAGRLIRVTLPETDLIETRRRETHPDTPKVTIGTWFRIEFDGALKDASFIALQNTHQIWGCVPAAQRDGMLFLPGFDEGGEPDIMREQRDDGKHRFIALQTRRPLPPELRAAARDGVSLDHRLLLKLVDAYMQEAKSRRRLFVLDVEITKPRRAQS